MTISFSLRFALVATAVAIAPGKAVWGQEHPKKKLDTSLQQVVQDGCSGGPRNVIIRVKSGYRKGMRDSLSAHGDGVNAELKSIDAVAAEVHCDDLPALAAMSAIESVSTDAPMQAHGPGKPRRRSPGDEKDGDDAAAGGGKQTSGVDVQDVARVAGTAGGKLPG